LFICVYAVVVPLVFSQTTCCSMIGLSVCKKNRFAPFFALLTNSSFSRFSFYRFFVFFFFSSPKRAREREQERKRKIFVCRLLHNKQHAPSESEWCCIGQHYSDLFIMNGCRTRKRNVVHANVF
jgi:hypothetical protein